MGDDKAGPPLHQPVHGVLDLLLGTGIDRACRLIQDHDRRVGKDGPGNGQQLLLPGGNIVCFLIDLQIIALGLSPDEEIDMGSLCSSLHLFVRGVGPAVADVLPDRPAVQPGVLQDHAEHAAEVLAGIVPDVPAVHADPAAVKLIKAHHQLDDRSLAGSRRADDGNALTRFCGKGKVLDDRFLGVVAEPDADVGEPLRHVRRNLFARQDVDRPVPFLAYVRLEGDERRQYLLFRHRNRRAGYLLHVFVGALRRVVRQIVVPEPPGLRVVYDELNRRGYRDWPHEKRTVEGAHKRLLLLYVKRHVTPALNIFRAPFARRL